MCLVSSIVEHSTDNRKTEERYLYQIPDCSCRLLARTLPFQGGEDGSKPFGSTILKHIAEVGSVRQGDPIAHVVSVF